MRVLKLMGLLVLLAGPAAAQEAVTLPGGASALNETHGDWLVRCEAQSSGIACALQQEQIDTSTRQRVIAIELAPDAGRLTGSLVLPFGLALEPGVRLQLDDGAPLPPLKFRTCLPAGCIVNLRFEADAVSVLRTISALKVAAIADAGGDTPFSISFKGFGSALDRAVALLQ